VFDRVLEASGDSTTNPTSDTLVLLGSVRVHALKLTGRPVAKAACLNMLVALITEDTSQFTNCSPVRALASSNMWPIVETFDTSHAFNPAPVYLRAP
jgi:hypothetical protein